jgi:hypothetical protein
MKLYDVYWHEEEEDVEKDNNIFVLRVFVDSSRIDDRSDKEVEAFVREKTFEIVGQKCQIVIDSIEPIFERNVNIIYYHTYGDPGRDNSWSRFGYQKTGMKEEDLIPFGLSQMDDYASPFMVHSLDQLATSTASDIDRFVRTFKKHRLKTNVIETEEDKLISIFVLNKTLEGKYHPMKFDFLTIEEWDRIEV